MFNYRNEQEYNSSCKIKYVLEESKVGSKFLIVVFSAFNGPEQPIQHSYNYMRTLESLDANKLYILDNYGPRGSYYLGGNLDGRVESSVISLVTYISRVLNIAWSDIIAVGSSKGGSSALYYGVKYNFGSVISGAPQIRIADYLAAVTPETEKYILGEVNEQSRNRLNNLIYNQFNKHILTRIYLLSSPYDAQFKDHVKPFIKFLEEQDIAINYLLDEKMKSHADIAKSYPAYLINTLIEVMYKKVSMEGISVRNKGTYIEIEDMNCDENPIQYIATNAQKEKIMISNKCFTPMAAGTYEIKMQVIEEEKIFYEKLLDKIVFGGEYFKLNAIQFEINDGMLEFKLDIEEKQDLQYAFYILKNNEICKKIWYQKEASIQQLVEEHGKYQVIYFILAKDGTKVIDKSEIKGYS